MKHQVNVPRRRPRLCAGCGVDAVWADVTVTPIVVLRRNGSRRFREITKTVYWCASCAPSMKENP